MMDAFNEAGLPPGCINLVQGGRATGTALLDCEIDGLLFTGSEKTGRFFHAHYAGRPDIILALELGGNNPLIVWDPADVEMAADIAVQSAFITTGQRCTCARRLILPDNQSGDAIVEAIVEMMRHLSLGPWHDETAFMGPLVSASAASETVAFQEKLLKSGGRSIVGSQQRNTGLGFVTAGLIEMQDAATPDEECFGPLLQVHRVNSIDNAIACANATRFGLSASFVSQDEDLWQKVRPRIRAGILNFNRPTTGASSAMPFGGPGMSGNLRPGGYYAADYCAWPQVSQIAV
jgi:succinylglutamic semialdehyde dehydrogenase